MRKTKDIDLSVYFSTKKQVEEIVNKYAEVRVSFTEPSRAEHSSGISFGIIGPGWEEDCSKEAIDAFVKLYFKFLRRFKRESGIKEITSRFIFKPFEDWDINELRGEINVLIKAYEIRKGKSWIELFKEHMVENWGQSDQVQHQETTT